MLLSLNKDNKSEGTVMVLQGNLSTNMIVFFLLFNYNPTTILTHLSLQHSFDIHVVWLFSFYR